MTDPVTNVEIEDVLSSIRRLVSDDARGAKPPAPRVEQPDRLVLTPALRVTGEGPSTVEAPAPDVGARDVAPVPDPVESQEKDDAPILLTEFAPLIDEATPVSDDVETADELTEIDDSIVSFQNSEEDLTEATSDTAVDTRADASVAVEEDTLEQRVVDLALVATDQEAGVSEIEETAEATGGDHAVEASLEDVQPDENVDDLTSQLLSRLVEDEVEQALSDLDLDAEPEAAAAENATPDNATPENVPSENESSESINAVVLDESDAGSTTGDLQDVLADMAEQDAPVTDPATQTLDTEVGESLESKIAALEELVGRSHAEDWEPEQSMPEAPVFKRSSDVLDWQDHLPEEHAAGDVADAVDGDQPEREPDETSPDEGATAAGTVTSDEAMLRRMVSDIVRQELQGALGERITRNVRKLVRREIHRVLMSQDFD
ncbi:MAG: hypothetical protein ACRBB0_24855 [Pelagimonas sp.]|uniref:hypothetical protein n=1 Tax=Pelagimonas sp. TaxID=2073170 RepID=UPI003D6AC88F